MCTELFVHTYTHTHIYIHLYPVISSDAFFNSSLQLFFNFQIVCVASHMELPEKMAITEVASCIKGNVGGGLERELLFVF